jgi:hypothetical protein
MSVFRRNTPAMTGLSLLSAVLALALAAVFIAGCNSNRTKIGDIDSHPDRFAGKDVRIGGEVTDVLELPLGIANISAYRINDDTGQIWVISHNGAPNRGDKVGLKGTAEPIDRDSMPFLRDIFGDVIEEHERREM